MNKTGVAIILLLGLVNFVFAQDKEMDKQYNKARNKYATGHFEESRDIYIELLKKEPRNFVFNYELAMLYFYELNQKKKSIPYFETAKSVMKDTIADLYNYLGQAYQENLEYDKAIESYQTYSSIPPEEGVIRVSVRRYINDCMDEKQKIEEIKEKRQNLDKSGIQIINAGPKVNSEKDELAPIPISENEIIFTSSRKFDYVFNEFVYQPYKCRKDGNEYSTPEILNSTKDKHGLIIDDAWHQIITSMTMDGNAFTCIYENDVWVIAKKGKEWGEPEKLGRSVNRTKQNSWATISANGKRLIVSLYDKKNKTFDLYQTNKNSQGEWSPVQKLNKQINTISNEHYPSLSQDGYTLYFSSDREGGHGKYDIYKSQLQENNEWGRPEILPLPINSDGNDICYVKNNPINKAYFSSDRKGGFGKYDIFEIIY